MRHENSADMLEIVSIHLGQDREKKYFTVGLHPWWMKAVVSSKQKIELEALLSDPCCLAMGEMGLDKLKGPPINEQMNFLRSQLNIAEEMSMPVIIHCVRAYNQLIQIKKEFPAIKKWCVHGYGRHSILAKQLIDQGFYLSLMPTIEEKYLDWFTTLPNNKLFLETDSMPEADILDIYHTVSRLTNISIEELQAQMNNNASDFFER
ncbi:MAG: TatD family hydrolase [Cyclobacteriaceae bacterium]